MKQGSNYINPLDDLILILKLRNGPDHYITLSGTGVDILISSRFCGPLCAEIFKLISAGSIFCDNFHFSKFCGSSQDFHCKLQISVFANFKFHFFSNRRAAYSKFAKIRFCVFQSFIFFKKDDIQYESFFERRKKSKNPQNAICVEFLISIRKL